MQLDFLQKNLKSCLVQISNSYHLYESIDNGWVPRFRSYFWVLGSSVPFCRSVVSDSVTPRTAAHQASLSSTNSQSLLNLMFVESMMPSNHLTLWPPLLLLPFCLSPRQDLLQWVSSLQQVAKYWSFSFSISPPNEYSGLISFRIDWFDLIKIDRCDFRKLIWYIHYIICHINLTLQ